MSREKWTDAGGERRLFISLGIGGGGFALVFGSHSNDRRS